MMWIISTRVLLVVTMIRQARPQVSCGGDTAPSCLECRDCGGDCLERDNLCIPTELSDLPFAYDIQATGSSTVQAWISEELGTYYTFSGSSSSPVYRKVERSGHRSTGGSYLHLTDARNQWVVSLGPGNSHGVLRAESGLIVNNNNTEAWQHSLPPLAGWEYLRNGTWTKDPDIAITPKGVNCSWTEYKCGDCSRITDGLRHCNRTVATAATVFGAPCEGPTNRTESCDQDIDCLWSEWTSISGCTEICRGRRGPTPTRKKMRTVLVPQNGDGEACDRWNRNKEHEKGSMEKDFETCNYQWCTNNPGCPNGWVLLGDRCLTYRKELLSWLEADVVCGQEGGHLVSIHDLEENSAVSALLPSGHFWTGASSENPRQEMAWSDNSSWTFSNLRNVSGHGSVAIDFRGIWYLVESSSDKLWYCCQKKVENVTIEEKTTGSWTERLKKHRVHNVRIYTTLRFFGVIGVSMIVGASFLAILAVAIRWGVRRRRQRHGFKYNMAFNRRAGSTVTLQEFQQMEE